jgi:alpha-tubulin suppressor-like RCC1 family protein
MALAAATAVAVSLVVALGAAPALGATYGPAAAKPAAATTTTAFTWGDNSAGELCNGTLTASETPESAPGLGGVTAIAEGGRHLIALTSNGTVQACGDDTFGQLGNGTASANGTSEVFAPVPGLKNVTAVAAGEEHSLALLSNGTVMAWGDGNEGQLGDGSMSNSAVPVPVQGLTGVKAIAAGSLFSLALLKNGTVMAWGDNRFGELGNGTEVNSDVPVAVSGLSGVTAIAGGGFFSLALLSNGTIMSWGDNESSQLGDGQDLTTQPESTVPVAVSGISTATAISAGTSHAVALLTGGTVMVWGDNSFFQLAQSNGFPGGIPNSDVPLAVSGLPAATAIAAGGLFTLAVVAGGQVDGWGDNAYGQLGNGSNSSSPSVVQATGVSGVTTVAAGDDQGIAFSTTSTGSATTSTGTLSSPWRIAGNPVDPPAADGLDDIQFSGVSAVSASDAWSVGASSALFDPLPLAEHWNGTTWDNASVPLPSGASTASLAGVDELSSDNAWAVGSIGAPSGTGNLTLIEHWNGSAWSVVPSPNPVTGTGDTDRLTAISGTSPTDLWAVGSYGTDEFNAMLFEHWNGTAWSFVPPPSEDEEFGEGITVISPTDVWAVGSEGGTGTISANWNGTAWTFVSTPELTDGAAPVNQLTEVTATGPDNVWASGYESNVDEENFQIPYVLHWNGTAWSLTEVPNAGSEGSLLRGITALSASDVWASGQTQQSDGGLLSLTEHFNGTTWSSVPSLDPGETGSSIDNTFDAITSAAPNTLFAVGTQEVSTQCCLMALAERSTQG